jgi:hypothetical protein
MGSRLQKIAFIVFALLFVAVIAIMNSSILTMATSANGQLTSIVSSDDASLNIYDQQKVFGSTSSQLTNALILTMLLPVSCLYRKALPPMALLLFVNDSAIE